MLFLKKLICNNLLQTRLGFVCFRFLWYSVIIVPATSGAAIIVLVKITTGTELLGFCGMLGVAGIGNS